MVEAKKNKKNKTKKSSKVLDKNINLNSEELLEQIVSKKKNKTKQSSSTKRGSSTNKNRVNKIKKNENELSSDDIYEQIKQKKNKKTKSSVKKELLIPKVDEKQIDNDIKIDFKNAVLEPRKDEEVTFNKAIKEIKEENEDLIITREIRFDDLSSNLKDKKNLEDLKNAIEEFDKLDADKSINNLTDDIELLPSVKYSNYKFKKNAIIIISIVLLLFIIVSICFVINNISHSIRNDELLMEQAKVLEEQRKFEEEQRKKKILYDDCLKRPVSEADLTENVLNAQSNLTNYIKDNYNASVSYEDLTYGFNFNYNQDKIYYAASTIKSLVALYVYKSASEGKINLDATITYTSKFKVSYSEGVKKHKLGSKIPLRTLVKYSIIYSDNSAHQMLVSYIGKNNLKAFGKSLGAKNTLSGGDNFGNISASDGLIYMKAINEFFENNSELGGELKGYFIEAGQKEITVDNFEVANKYGLYKKYYHNIGIVYDSSPYVISVMTLEGNNKKEQVVSDIAVKINELHNLFKSNRKDVCEFEVYGNKKSTSS